VLVVGNYRPDQQQSMRRYSELLLSIYNADHDAQLVQAPCLVGRLPGLPAPVCKYLAYIDKLLIFPIWLVILSTRFDLVHIADHSNAFYVYCCLRRQTIVTCHDLLAVRAAFGDATTACTPSPIGIWLQRLILAGLRRAGAVMFISEATRKDYELLLGKPLQQRHAVVPLPLNAPFCPDPQAFSLTPSELALIPDRPYLLMVGSALPRKNRAMALLILQHLGATSIYHLVFAGAPLTPLEQKFRVQQPLGERLITIERPSHALLNRLYCEAHALLFPSFSEGFGWPLLEAQICHCPVIASNTTSIPEVAGAGALYADPTDVLAFVAHVRALEQPADRARLISFGSLNTRRYNQDSIAEACLRFAFQR
jgi:glycosyltransferase involved in cell wall biosynthesis